MVTNLTAYKEENYAINALLNGTVAERPSSGPTQPSIPHSPKWGVLFIIPNVKKIKIANFKVNNESFFFYSKINLFLVKLALKSSVNLN